MKLNERLVIDSESEGSDCDAYFTKAYYDDTGEPLNDSELDQLTDLYGDVLEEQALDRAIMHAEHLYDTIKGH
jgi:hypothetical protein